MKKLLLYLLLSTIFVYANTINTADSFYSKSQYKKAFESYKKACQNKSSEGCYKVGFMYENKQSIKQNLKKAFEFYNKACTLGNERACYKVGVCYDKGGILKLETDYKKVQK